MLRICRRQSGQRRREGGKRLKQGESGENISTCAVAIWLGAAIKQQKYNSHILPSAL